MSDDVTAMLARVHELDEAATPGPGQEWWAINEHGRRTRRKTGDPEPALLDDLGGWLGWVEWAHEGWTFIRPCLSYDDEAILPAIAAELEAVRAAVLALAPVRVSINDWPSSECPCCEAQGPALADMLDLPHTDGCLWVRCGGVRRG